MIDSQGDTVMLLCDCNHFCWSWEGQVVGPLSYGEGLSCPLDRAFGVLRVKPKIYPRFPPLQRYPRVQITSIGLSWRLETQYSRMSMTHKQVQSLLRLMGNNHHTTNLHSLSTVIVVTLKPKSECLTISPWLWPRGGKWQLKPIWLLNGKFWTNPIMISPLLTRADQN